MPREYQNPKGFLPWFLFIVISLIWGSSFILIKKGLQVYPPMQVGSLRVCFAYTVLLPVAVYHFRNIPKEKMKILFICGLIGNLFPAYLFATAQTQISSSITGILNALTPLFTMAVAVLVFKNQYGNRQILGLFIGFAGSILLILMKNDMKSFGQINYYAFFVVLATVMYATNTNIMKIYLHNIKPLHIASAALFFVGPFAIIHLFTTDFIRITSTQTWAWKALICLFILGTLSTSLAFIMFNKLLQMTSPIFASSVTYVIPIVAVAWGIFDNEHFYFVHLVAMLLIILGIYLSNK